MTAQKDSLCLTTTLPSEYKTTRYGAKEYKLDIKPLILGQVEIGFNQCKFPQMVDGVTYTHYAAIYWKKTLDPLSYDLCTNLEKDVASLLKKNITISLATLSEEDVVIQTVTRYPKTEAAFVTECSKVKICFPSVDVYPNGNIVINAVLRDYTLPKIK